MKKLSVIPAPALAGVVRERTVRAACAEIGNCVYGGAQMIDLHLSCLEDDSVEAVKTIVSASRLPILALNYNSTYEWKELGLTEEERTASLLRAAKAGAAGIDMQGYTFDTASLTGYVGTKHYSFTEGNPKEIVTDEGVISKQCALIEEAHALGAEVLLSCHPGIYMNCDQVVELALFLEKRSPDIIKIVTGACDDEEQMIEVMRTMVALKKELRTPVSYHANGKAAALTRIVNPLLGGQIAFCVDRFSESSTMGQLDLRTARRIVDDMKKIL